MKCRFCGCTDKKPCAIAMVNFVDDDIVGRSAGIALRGQLAHFTTPCHWSAPDTCSAPGCIEQAYVEVAAIVDQLFALEAA